MPHISQLKESKYLKKEDCVPPLLLTIASCDQVDVAMEGDPPDIKWCVHFVEDVKPMILNSTNAELISRAVQSEVTEEWTGRKIVLFSDPNVSFKGKLVGGIRVRPPKKLQAPVAPAPASEDDDNIPF